MGQNYTFSQYFDFIAPSDSRRSNSCSSAKYCPILTNYIYQWKTSLFSINLNFIDPYDWFCGPRSHLFMLSLQVDRRNKYFSTFGAVVPTLFFLFEIVFVVEQ